MKSSAPTILVIEDEPSMRAWMERILTSAGYQVEPARDGREALSLIDRKRYSLLVIDLVMPVVSGFEVLDELQRRKVEIPTLITSGVIVPEVHQYLKTHEGMTLMSKPLHPEEFLDTVERLAGRPPGRKTTARRRKPK